MWIKTYSRKRIDFLNSDPSQIDIKDIAMSLSRLPRFVGHTKLFYSVAQHCVECSFHAKQYPLEVLLHDAHEAYMNDIPAPLKFLIREHTTIWDDVSNDLDFSIRYRFDLSDVVECREEINIIDRRMLITEARMLDIETHEWEGDWPEPFAVLPQPLGITDSRDLFLQRFSDLT